MTEKPKRTKYVPPRLVDLSGSSAFGQVTGSCEDGSQLTFTVCTPTGGAPVGGDCLPSGFVPQRGYCDFGEMAVEGCTSGQGHF